MSDAEIKVLEKAIEQIWDKACELGLDPFPIHFEIVPATVIYEIGSYALPGRYSHWSFGKAYHKMKLMYDLGLSKLYEVVINTNPAYAFLLEGNSLVQNKMIIAHVIAHVDFFKNNIYFSRTNRRMVDEAVTHAERIREYEFKYGRKTVEEFLDAVLSIQEHINPDLFIREERAEAPEKPKTPAPKPGKYDDLFALDELKKEKVSTVEEEEDAPRRIPPPTGEGSGALHHDPLAGVGALAARHHGDDSRGDGILRPPTADEDHERGLGQLLAHAHPPGAGPQR